MGGNDRGRQQPRPRQPRVSRLACAAPGKPIFAAPALAMPLLAGRTSASRGRPARSARSCAAALSTARGWSPIRSPPTGCCSKCGRRRAGTARRQPHAACGAGLRAPPPRLKLPSWRGRRIWSMPSHLPCTPWSLARELAEAPDRWQPGAGRPGWHAAAPAADPDLPRRRSGGLRVGVRRGQPGQSDGRARPAAGGLPSIWPPTAAQAL